MRAYARHYNNDETAGAWLVCCTILTTNYPSMEEHP